MNENPHLGIIGISILVITVIAGLSVSVTVREQSDNLPCYDRAGNVIQGVTCSGSTTSEQGLFIVMPILIIGGFVGMILLFLDLATQD